MCRERTLCVWPTISPIPGSRAYQGMGAFFTGSEECCLKPGRRTALACGILQKTKAEASGSGILKPPLCCWDKRKRARGHGSRAAAGQRIRSPHRRESAVRLPWRHFVQWVLSYSSQRFLLSSLYFQDQLPPSCSSPSFSDRYFPQIPSNAFLPKEKKEGSKSPRRTLFMIA